MVLSVSRQTVRGFDVLLFYFILFYFSLFFTAYVIILVFHVINRRAVTFLPTSINAAWLSREHSDFTFNKPLFDSQSKS